MAEINIFNFCHGLGREGGKCPSFTNCCTVTWWLVLGVRKWFLINILQKYQLRCIHQN